MNTFAQAVNSNMDELPASHFMDAVYRQHNSPGCFIEYFSDTIKKLASTGKTIYLLGDFNLAHMAFRSPENQEISIQPGLLTGLIKQLSPSKY